MEVRRMCERENDMGLGDMVNKIAESYGSLAIDELPENQYNEVDLAVGFVKKMADFCDHLRAGGVTNGGGGWSSFDPDAMRAIARAASDSLSPLDSSEGRQIVISVLDTLHKVTGRMEFFWWRQSILDD